MQNFKEFNREKYTMKIKKKWKNNLDYYESRFDLKGWGDQEENIRFEKLIIERNAVNSFVRNGLPPERTKGRNWSPDWQYKLIFIKQEEKRELKKYLRYIIKKGESLESINL